MSHEIPDYSSENLKWTRRQIGKAKSKADFDQIEIDIHNDIFEREPWATDEARLKILLQLFTRKRNEAITSES